MVGHQAKNLTQLVTKKVHELNNDDLRTHIEKRRIGRYKQSCKTLQVNTIQFPESLRLRTPGI
ncbi:hypothetical protein PGT21_014537 [Puccinia graminis f. sp. tritici]|uniref:Uncharacterized protein n=1 Tax=Puccinia graminis f. sp. tritici TaxID=56615 RepID=A0A5B0P5L8_PUCGR|nr:hypothetical protein PGTUg99_010960 [Puccinia graminis f. sp. tritici]KAA1099605.1 hypothetical protein PGT21_014537 [Puccinia graminis f. sp. tritici]